MDKIDFKKEYKDLYMPKKVSIIDVPKMKFIAVSGKGDPNKSKEYQDAISILYGLSFAIKMNKNIKKPYDYVVPPLEGLWKGTDSADFEYNLDKDNLEFLSMIRQPDFVTGEMFEEASRIVSTKKKELDVKKAEFLEIEDGLCVQMLHIGPYDNEPESFRALREYIAENGYKKKDNIYHHREIYLTDPRKCAPEKNKTVLRYKVFK